jgi:hypothetical protein
VLGALVECTRATQAALAGVPLDDAIGAARRGELHPAVRPEAFVGVRRCAAPARDAAAALELYLLESRTAAASPPLSLDAWPVLRLETGPTDDVYVHDYVLLVDALGNDVYRNNAGSNVVDVESGPAGSLARRVGPARGCPGSSACEGGVGSYSTPAAALLLDLDGDDVYGVRERRIR